MNETLRKVANGKMDLFIKNPKNLNLFIQYRAIVHLNANIAKQAELDARQEQSNEQGLTL